MRWFLLLLTGCAVSSGGINPLKEPPRTPRAPKMEARAELRDVNLDGELAKTLASAFVYVINGDGRSLQEVLKEDALNRRLGDFLFVTVYGVGRPLRLYARAVTYKEALEIMLTQLRGERLRKTSERLSIRVEEVKGVYRKQEVRRLAGGRIVRGERPTESLFEVAQNLRLGLDSIMVADKKTGKVSFLMSDEMLLSGITEPFGWQAVLETKYPSTSLFARFRTIAFLYTHPQGEVVPLLRLRRRETVADAMTVREAITDAADYLLRIQKESGRFGYFYNAAKDKFLRGESYIRQAGTACALLEVYALTGKKAYLDGACRTLEWLAGLCKRNKKHDFIYIKEPDSRVSLGSTSVFLWALATYRRVSGDDKFDETAHKAARFLLFMQREDGSFNTYYDEATDVAHYKDVKYYPGEATLALAVAADVFDEERYFEAAMDAYRALSVGCAERRRKRPYYVDAWLMKAAAELSKHLKEPELAVIYSMADTLVGAQEALSVSPYIDYRGSFSVKHGYPSGISDAALCEGLAAAYRIAMERSHSGVERYADALKKQAVFHLRHRIDYINGHFLPNLKRAYGAFTSSLIHLNVRIDGVQHTISALIGTLPAFIKE